MLPITLQIESFSVNISEHFSYEDLKKDWQSIQEDQTVPFFLSWNWISCWLKTYKISPVIVTASINGAPVCIGLFTRSTEKRRGFISSQQIRLHQTGNAFQDQIWMEYNDFICIDKYRENAVNACLQALNHDNQWDEIILSMMPATRAMQVAEANPYASLDLYRPCYAVNLKNVRNSKKDYLSFLTANTRYQIKRSIRLYEKKYGKISMSVANDTEEAIQFFRQAGPYHQQRWHDSGFANPLFTEFHENLINKSFEDSSIYIIKITAGQETIAIMYYHHVNGSLYFYLHGLRYDNERKIKPGLVAHALATQYFIDQGMSYYDYMGGYSQYKEQLADLSERLGTVVIQRPRSRFKFETMARNFKNRIISPQK